MVILFFLVILLAIFGGQDIKQALNTLIKGISSHFFSTHGTHHSCPATQPAQGGRGTQNISIMHNLANDYTRIVFATWAQKQREKQHESDPEKRLDTSRQPNAKEISDEAAKMRETIYW